MIDSIFKLKIVRLQFSNPLFSLVGDLQSSWSFSHIMHIRHIDSLNHCLGIFFSSFLQLRHHFPFHR